MRDLVIAILAISVSTRSNAADICFKDVAAEAGLSFSVQNSASPQKRLIETMAGGLAVFDYDNDGRPDIFFTNGAALPSLEKDSPRYYNRLFRNEGNWKFRDITQQAGVMGAGYSMGAAAADFDNDGKTDLFVAGVRRHSLYRNLGGGRFEDITAKSGIAATEWTVAAAWLDFDGDGLLDLFLANYGQWSPDSERFCGDSTRKVQVYCHPRYYAPRPNQLFRNLGGGRFEDVSTRSGIANHKGRAMGIGVADYDRDGRVDIFVTNDNAPNFLFHNDGSGKFTEVALAAGVAMLDAGKPVAGMGTDFRDFDNDGLPDIVFVALTGETYPLFRNLGKGAFADVTHKSKLASVTNPYAGWGAILADFDNDGWKDLFTSNAHVNDLVEQFESTTYRQSNTVFANARDGQFRLADCPALKTSSRAHRGAAAADFDGDGKLDLVVSSLGEPAELWRNTSNDNNHWLVVRLQGSKSNRDGIGAVVQLLKQTNENSTSQGYASSSATGVHFGLGDNARVPEIHVTWPSGIKQVVKDVTADQVVSIKEPGATEGR